MRPLVLLGGGGHCNSCIDVIEQEAKFKIVAILDPALKKGAKIYGYDVVGGDEKAVDFVSEEVFFLITIGQVRTAETRIKTFNLLTQLNAKFATIVSPRAYVSKHAKLGLGTIIMHDALINAGAYVGNNCIVNTKSLIEHDAHIGNHCHISTGSVVNGNVKVLEGAFFGSAAVSKQGVTVERGGFIKAGSIFKG
ncbi:MAG: acetyltransferase [Halioglobus sp.]